MDVPGTPPASMASSVAFLVCHTARSRLYSATAASYASCSSMDSRTMRSLSLAAFA